MRNIDLRSDTVTYTTPEMRKAMAQAEVGDDVYGEDPTVNRLQETAAELTGKEAGLFVASGTMGNLTAVLAHCSRGDEAILGDKSHTFLFEAGGISVLGGVHSRQVPNQPDGTLRLEDIQAAIRDDDPHYPISRVVCLENTVNRCGGAPLTVDYTRQVGELAHQNGLSLHLDGARLFNAAVAQEVQARDLADPADSVTFCLSKALCAPVGSVLCGSNDFIQRAHRIRKQLGGGMRQAGILAAAGIVALNTMIDRLREDHARARRLAEGIALIPGMEIDPNGPKTNMVFCSVSQDIPDSAESVAEQLKSHGVLVGVVGKRSFRLVTHYWIDDAGVEQAIDAFARVLRASVPASEYQP